jgi:hypothetical protein
LNKAAGHEEVQALLRDHRGQERSLSKETAVAVLEASRDGKYLKIRALLKKDRYLVFVQGRLGSTDSFTPLHWAAMKGHVRIAKCLLANGANVGARDNHGHTPLHLAAGWGGKRMVKLLLANGAAIEDDLWYAAREGQKAVVELLLARGAAVHASDNRGRTALTMARLNGHKDVEELLRRHGGRDWPDLG